ncbi:NO-inducible flavohemoprotein [Bacillus massiliglaciei]|uniref:NO-inducible flavohemoprotein n=1 Tax=Bacillus massiliglaciei TaxID=1816693 RepID=UPI000DA62F11|nr:NO-inducible flavohemoprotein [Bacillus massiliglaciei]
MLSQQTIQIIKATVPVLEAKGVEITTVFYRNLFQDYPQLLNIFNQTNQKKGRQQTALANTVLAAAKYIDRLETILPVVKQIAQKHRSLMVKPEHYPIVGEYLLAAIKEVLGDAATDEIIGAWGEAYGVIAQVFIDIEKEMYEEAEQRSGGWADFKEFIVADKVKESEVITSFYLKPVDGGMVPSFIPGQYVTVRVKIPGEEYLVNRQYSLSAAPNKESFRVSVKREKEPNTPEGRASNYLHDQVGVNDRIALTVPAGVFTLEAEKNKAPLVFIGAGVGVTPLMSMVQSIAKQEPGRKVTFVQAAKNPRVQAFQNELESLEDKLSDFRLTFVYSEQMGGEQNDKIKQGHVDEEFLRNLKADADSEYYICGPVPFLKAVTSGLRELEIPDEKVHFEFFGPAEAIH